MLVRCLNAKIGAKLGNHNISIIAYCDDVILMSPTIRHLNILLEICYKYSVEWKLQYNQSKSVFMKFDERKNDLIQELPVMNGIPIEQQDSMIYLGLPLGSNNFISEFFDKNMSKSERAFYSLYGLGCRPFALNPKTIAFIYKQFAQSIFRHGLDMLEITCTQLNMLEIRQNKLIKNAIGIGKFCKTTPLNNPVICFHSISDCLPLIASFKESLAELNAFFYSFKFFHKLMVLIIAKFASTSFF